MGRDVFKKQNKETNKKKPTNNYCINRKHYKLTYEL